MGVVGRLRYRRAGSGAVRPPTVRRLRPTPSRTPPRRRPGRRRWSHDHVPERRHTRGARGGRIPLLQHPHRARRPHSGAGGAVERRGPHHLPLDRRLHRFVGGAGSAAERSGCPEDTSGGGHLEPAETARRQRAANSHAVVPCMRTARQRASGYPRAGGQRSSLSSNPGQSPDHPACRRTLRRLLAAELAGRLVPFDLAGPAPGSGRGDRDRAERSGGHPPAPIRPQAARGMNLHRIGLRPSPDCTRQCSIIAFQLGVGMKILRQHFDQR